MEDAQQPAHVVLLHGLVQDLLAVPGHPQRVLEARLLPVLTHLLPEDLLVQLDGAADRVVKTQVVPVLLLQVAVLVHSQHYLYYEQQIQLLSSARSAK